MEAGRDGEPSEWAGKEEKTSDGTERREESKKGGRLRILGGK